MIYFVHLNIQTPYFYAYSIPFRVIVKGFIHIHLLQTQSESERERELREISYAFAFLESHFCNGILFERLVFIIVVVGFFSLRSHFY